MKRRSLFDVGIGDWVLVGDGAIVVLCWGNRRSGLWVMRGDLTMQLL